MLPPEIWVNDCSQEGPRPSGWALSLYPRRSERLRILRQNQALVVQTPGTPMPPWVSPFGGGLAEVQPLNLPPIDPSLVSSMGTGHINDFNLGSWVPEQDTNGYQIDQQPGNRLIAPVNPLKRKFSADAQEVDNGNQNGEYHLAEESGDTLNTEGVDDRISQQPHNTLAAPVNLLKCKTSVAAQEWNRRKDNGEYSSALDELMQYQGLEEVKQHFLDIKSKVNICQKQDPDGDMNVLKLERFNVVFQGNPGTGGHAMLSAGCLLMRLTYILCERQDNRRSIIR